MESIQAQRYVSVSKTSHRAEIHETSAHSCVTERLAVFNLRQGVEMGPGIRYNR